MYAKFQTLFAKLAKYIGPNLVRVACNFARNSNADENILYRFI